MTPFNTNQQQNSDCESGLLSSRKQTLTVQFVKSFKGVIWCDFKCSFSLEKAYYKLYKLFVHR